MVRESTNETNAILDVKNKWTNVTLDFEYGVTDRITLTAELPYAENTRRQGYNTANPEYSASGIGDLQLGGRYWFAAPQESAWNFYAELGVRAPTGKDDGRDIQGNFKKPYILPGTGQWALSPSIGFFKKHKALSFLGSGGYSFNLNKNDAGYESADTAHLSVGGAWNALAFGDRKFAQLNLSLMLSGIWISDRDKRDGVEVANTGGTWYYAAPSISFTPDGGRTSLYLSTPFLLDKKVNSLQTYEDVSYHFGVEVRF